MGPYKVFFFPMQLDLISHMKLVWHPMFIMVLLVLIIGFFQNFMDLSEDVLNPFNEIGGFVSLRLNIGILFLYGRKGQCEINQTQWLKP
jgi:hypothetical protein